MFVLEFCVERYQETPKHTARSHYMFMGCSDFAVRLCSTERILSVAVVWCWLRRPVVGFMHRVRIVASRIGAVLRHVKRAPKTSFFAHFFCSLHIAKLLTFFFWFPWGSLSFILFYALLSAMICNNRSGSITFVGLGLLCMRCWM